QNEECHMDQSSQNNPPASALSGIRVVELSSAQAGMSCAEMLAWLGADVVKVETPAIAAARQTTTEKPGVDSYDFVLLNANKRSVECDLGSESGRDNLKKLIASADVFVEQLQPGEIEHLGFGYDTVKQINPAIVYTQLKGFPSEGSRGH